MTLELFYENAQIPIEGIIEVNPMGINRTLFERPRKDYNQENTRKTIQEAFEEYDRNPKEYGSIFYLVIPEKNWDGYKTTEYLVAYAKELGGEVANWVHQALEWAWAISNGTSWEDICNKPDTQSFSYRMLSWKHGYFGIVGSSWFLCNGEPACTVSEYFFGPACNVVPLVAVKKT